MTQSKRGRSGFPSFFLRTHASWLLLPLSVVVCGWIMCIRDMDSLGETMMTVRWAALSLPMLYPVVAGFSAIDAARARRSSLVVGTFGASRMFRIALTLVLVPAISAAAGFLVPVLTFIVVGQDLDPAGGWFRIASALLAEIAGFLLFASVGAMVGWVFRPVVSGIAAVVVSLALIHFLNSPNDDGKSDNFNPFLDNGASVSQIGVVFNLSHLWVRIAITVAVAVLVVSALSFSPTARSDRVWAVAVILAIVVITSVLSSLVSSYFLEDDARAPKDCEVVEGREFCVFEEHSSRFQDVRPTLSDLLQKAEGTVLEPVLVDRYEEMSRRYEPSGADVRGLPSLDRTDSNTQQLAFWMSSPLDCTATRGVELTPYGSEVLDGMSTVSSNWLSLYQYGSFTDSPEDVESAVETVLSCRS